jgi:hypothetical protein
MSTASFGTPVINSNPPGVQVIDGDASGPVTIVNFDVNNTIYLGKTPSVDPTNPNLSTPLAPGASTVLDGTVPTYAICNSGQTAQLVIYPGAISFSRT